MSSGTTPPHRATARLWSFAAVAAITAAPAHAQGTPEAATTLPTVNVTTTLPDRLDAVPGSSTVVTTRQLEAQRPYSIREAVQGVPGLHVVGEDAFGMNLNIGIRGLDPRRTSRTLLLEDGMPIHLAPYSDPSAHYATPLERIGRIEVIKGSGQIVHGPQTVGGVINFLTRPTPRSFSGDVDFSFGDRQFGRAAASLGNGGDWGGWLAEAAIRRGAGSRDGSHHRLRDVSLKTDLNFSATNSLRLKVGRYEEDSSFGEGGLDQARFDADPYANPFRNDKFELERSAFQAIHTLALGDKARLSTQFYVQRIDRASYRQLDAISEFDGVELDAGVLVAEIENETLRARAPDVGPENPACLLPSGDEIDYTVPGGFENYAAFCGNQMRPRSYRVWGLEPRLELEHQWFGVRGELIGGVRLHKEDISRRRYNGTFPTARENSPGTYFRDQLDIQTDAVAAYVQNTFFLGALSVTPGLRYESYRQRSVQVLAREDRPVNNGRSLEQRNTELLPGLGATWQAAPQTTVFAGVHRGIAPPRPDANLSPLDEAFERVDPELSTNIELGTRFAPLRGLRGEFTLFQIDFRNQIVPGYAVGRAQTFTNAGRSRNRGIELAGRADGRELAGLPHNPYLTLSYTHLATAEFASDLQTPLFAPGETETDVFVNVRGNRLPYAPKHLLTLGVGFEHASGWDARIAVNHVSEQYTDAVNSRAPDPNGQSGVIPSYATLSAAVNLRLPQATLYFGAGNLTDKVYLVSRVNGAFAGAPRQLQAGAKIRF